MTQTSFDDSRFELPDGVSRCPGCGRFVSIEDGFLDVAPGGSRGTGESAMYCNESCTAKVRCRHGHLLTEPCDGGCEQ